MKGKIEIKAGTLMREYEGTHPWITFSCDFRQVPSTLWLLLGEAQSKCAHIASLPLKPGVQKQMNLVYLAKGVHGTAAIEGNTLTEEEVKRYLEGHREIPESKGYLEQEIENITKAWDSVVKELNSNSTTITPDIVCGYNRMVLARLELEDGVVPGEIRKHSVGVLRYRGAPPADLIYLLTRYCNWLNDEDEWRPPSPEWSMAWAAVKAALAHLYLVWIHPFGDGNGRTARMIELKILGQAGIPQPAMHLLSNYYNETRAEYYRQLDRASKEKNATAFVQYAIKGFVDHLRNQILLIQKAQLTVAWESYVHELFSEKTGEAQRRRRELAITLASAPEPVARKDILTITTRLARMYANKTLKTVSRDITALQRMKLIVRTKSGAVRARLEIMRGFMPWRNQG